MPIHIRPKWVHENDFIGEFDITDFIVFSETGKLAHVSKMWEATKAQSILLDEAHAEHLSKSRRLNNANDREMDALLYEYLEIVKLSSDCLVKANIFLLQIAFFEYAIKEVFRLVFPSRTIPKKPKLIRDIIKPLEAFNVITEVPHDYKTHVLNNRDAVRNAFAHGDWTELPQSLANVNLFEVFSGIAAYFSVLQENLQKLKFDV